MEITTQKTKIKKFLDTNGGELDVIEQTFALEDAKSEFLESLNDTFGTEGIYFEALESKIEIKGLKPVHALPKFAVHHRLTKEPLGVLDPKNKVLSLTIDSRLQTLDDKIRLLKQTIIEANGEISKLEDRLSRRKWNVFVQLFQRRKLIRLESSIKDLRCDIQRNQNSIHATQSILRAELEVAAIFDNLISEMYDLGINVTNN